MLKLQDKMAGGCPRDGFRNVGPHFLSVGSVRAAIHGLIDVLDNYDSAVVIVQ